MDNAHAAISASTARRCCTAGARRAQGMAAAAQARARGWVVSPVAPSSGRPSQPGLRRPCGDALQSLPRQALGFGARRVEWPLYLLPMQILVAVKDACLTQRQCHAAHRSGRLVVHIGRHSHLLAPHRPVVVQLQPAKDAALAEAQAGGHGRTLRARGRAAARRHGSRVGLGGGGSHGWARRAHAPASMQVQSMVSHLGSSQRSHL